MKGENVQEPISSQQINEWIAEFDQVIDANPTRAKELAKQVHKLARSTHCDELVALDHRMQADLLRCQCKYEESLQHYRAALEKYQSLGDVARCAGASLGVGNTNWYMGNLDKALESYIEAEKSFASADIIGGQASALSNIGVIFGIKREFENARTYFQKALEIRLQMGESQFLGNSYFNLGNLLQDMGEYEQALEHYEKGLHLVEGLGIPRSITVACSMIGNLLSKMERYTEAAVYFEKAMTSGQESTDRYVYVQAILYAAENLGILKDFASARKMMMQCIRLCKRLHIRDLLKNAYKVLSELHERSRHYKLALRYFKLYTDVYNEVYSEESRNRINELHTRFETERKEREAEIYRLRNIELVGKQEKIEKQQEELNAYNRDLCKKNEEVTQSYEALQRAQQEIIKLERANSVYALAVTANHELNQPLMILSGNLDLLDMNSENNSLSEKQRHYIIKIREALNRIRSILERLRNIEEVRFEEYSQKTNMISLENTQEEAPFSGEK